MNTKALKTLILALFLAAVGCGTVEANNPDDATTHATPWCPTPAEAEMSTSGSQAGTVLAHVDVSTNPAACAGSGPFGQGLQPGQSWRFSTTDGSINVPVLAQEIPCVADQGGCLTSISFTPTDTSCTYVWQFKYCGTTDVGLCCETIMAQVVNPLSPATVSQ